MTVEPLGPDDIISDAEQRFLDNVDKMVAAVNAQLEPRLRHGLGQEYSISVILSAELRDIVTQCPRVRDETIKRFEGKRWVIDMRSVYQWEFHRLGSSEAARLLTKRSNKSLYA